MLDAKAEIHQPDELIPEVPPAAGPWPDDLTMWGYATDATDATVEANDGSRAVQVQTIFRGVVIGTRHLFDPEEKSTHRSGTAMLCTGIGVALLAVGLFIATAWDVGKERGAFESWQAAGKDPRTFPWKPSSRIGDVAVFGAFALGLTLSAFGLRRRGKTSPHFNIGPVADADAPVASEFIPSPAWSHALVAATGTDYVVNVTPGMDGEISVGKHLVPLPEFVQQRGPSFSLPRNGRARLDCGQTTFLVTATTRPRRLPVPIWTWRWDEHVYAVGSALALGVFLLMILAIPPDPRSLSLDLFNADGRFLPFRILAPEPPQEIPDFLNVKKSGQQGGTGQRHKDDEGKMGKATSKNRDGLVGIKGPKDNTDPHLAKKQSEERAKNAGILGVLKQMEGSHIASIFGRESALGRDADNIFGGLVGNQIAESYGLGGLGVVGTGRGGGGTGEGVIGTGKYGTLGKGGGGSGEGPGYGTGVGGLRGRRAMAPEVIPGIAHVRGTLDKEIIRRIIRRHINEVKFCYEQELIKKPGLGGRLMVQFTIAPTGQVITSVLQNSTMGNPRVESCTVQAVRRWEFPKPEGGGIVMVSYPFVLAPAGGGD